MRHLKTSLGYVVVGPASSGGVFTESEISNLSGCPKPLIGPTVAAKWVMGGEILGHFPKPPQRDHSVEGMQYAEPHPADD